MTTNMPNKVLKSLISFTGTAYHRILSLIVRD